MCVHTRKLVAKRFPADKSFEEETQWGCDALAHVFPKYKENPAYGTTSLCDISQCLAVLGDEQVFTKLLEDWDRNYFAPCYAKYDGKNKVSTIILYFLVSECGFKNIPGIVFYAGTGDAFLPVVWEGAAFKDGLSAVHGEYTHMLQWCVIGWANKMGRIKLSKPVVAAYKSLVDPLAMASQGEYFTEFVKKNNPNGATKKVSMWELVCDCFVPRSGQDDENVENNLFSRSFRSPAHLTEYLLRNQQKLQIGICHQDRYASAKRLEYLNVLTGTGSVQDIGATTQQRQGAKGKQIDAKGQVAFIPGTLVRDGQGRIMTAKGAAGELIGRPAEVCGARLEAIKKAIDKKRAESTAKK